MKARVVNRNQKGFSLVELMVALVVGLLLLAGVLQILLSNRESFSAQQALAGLQEKERLSSFVIENVVAHAGYRVALETPDQFMFPARENAGFSLAAGSAVSSKNADGDGNDAIRLRFQGSGGVHNCLGEEIGGPDADEFVEIADYELYVEDNILRCRVFDDDDIRQQPLVSNVERLVIRYGIDANEDNSVEAYVDSIDDSQQLDVRSIRLQMLIASDSNVLPTPVARQFRFADDSEITPEDRLARQVVDQTVALRNLLP